MPLLLCSDAAISLFYFIFGAAGTFGFVDVDTDLDDFHRAGGGFCCTSFSFDGL